MLKKRKIYILFASMLCLWMFGMMLGCLQQQSQKERARLLQEESLVRVDKHMRDFAEMMYWEEWDPTIVDRINLDHAGEKGIKQQFFKLMAEIMALSDPENLQKFLDTGLPRINGIIMQIGELSGGPAGVLVGEGVGVFTKVSLKLLIRYLEKKKKTKDKAMRKTLQDTLDVLKQIKSQKVAWSFNIFSKQEWKCATTTEKLQMHLLSTKLKVNNKDGMTSSEYAEHIGNMENKRILEENVRLLKLVINHSS